MSYNNPNVPLEAPKIPNDAAGFKKALGWQLGFFIAACMVIATSFITMLELFTEFAPFQFVSQVYLALFGLLMFILDWPLNQESMRPYRVHIYKFLLFMTRFVGRGVWYIFLGTMVFASFWDLDVSPFLGIVLGGYIVSLGVASTIMGLQLSMRLEKVRKLIRGDTQASRVENTCPGDGLSGEMFQKVCQRVRGDNQAWTPQELNYIICGLNHDAKHPEVISRQDYEYWVSDGRMAIL